MVVIAKSILTSFAEKHALASEPLGKWYNHVVAADWSCLADIKKDLNSVDFVGND